MLVSPLQNQEFQHRSEAVSEMRNQEHHKLLGDQQNVKENLQRKDEERSQTVQTKDDLQGADPDGGSGKREDEQVPKPRTHNKASVSLHDENPSRRLMGGQFVDLEA